MTQTKLVSCPNCGGIGRYYGCAPHVHDMIKTGGSFIGSTETLGTAEAAAQCLERRVSYREDPDCPGLGVTTCLVCGGTGEVAYG